MQSAEKEVPKDRADFFVQLIADSEMLHGFRTEMTHVINSIVKEELEKLGLEKNYYFDFFDPKPVQRLTLYYFYKMDVTKKGVLLHKVEEMTKKIAPQEVAIKTEVHFFGPPNVAELYKHEFVMVVEGKGLADLNGAFKEMAACMSKEHGKPFYKNEERDFLPHTGIGVLRINRIEEHIKKLKGEEFVAKVIPVIKERIEKTVREYIAKIPQEKRVIVFKTIGIFDPNSRKPQDPSCTGYLKEYALGA
jgi:hypothetical protein